MATAPVAPPALPTDSNMTGSGAVPSFPPQGASPFSGGLPALQKLVSQLESACQGLAQMLPSLAPLAANTISNFRTAIPSAVSSDAGANTPSAPNPGVNGVPPGSAPAGQALPSPPTQ